MKGGKPAFGGLARSLDRLTLKWKIFAMLLGFCALLLVILWLFQTVFLDAFYKHIRFLEVKRSVELVAGNLDRDNIMELIDGISKADDIVIEIVEMPANGIQTAFPSQDWRMAADSATLIAQARGNKGEHYEYYSEYYAPPRGPQPPFRLGPWSRQQAQPQSLAYVKVVDYPSGAQVAVIIRAVISPVNATVTTLRYQLYYISGIMLFFSIALAIAMAKRVSKPIEQITRSARSLAKGDYDARFAGKGFSEIVALSDTLNTAAVELGRVEGLRRELLANVSHDLRTPLALIYSYAEMMNDFPDEATPEQTKAIMDEARRMATLVNDILDISKLESDMEKLDASRFNLTQDISDTTSRIAALLKNEGFEITFSRDSDVEVYVDADELKISRAFYNLLINAVNYSGGCRSVSVAQAVFGNSVRISVKDGGAGISEADLPFVWERYYKSGQEHKRAVTGTGLGLSIVRKIIELHGGRYGVESEVGKGSVFWFEIRHA